MKLLNYLIIQRINHLTDQKGGSKMKFTKLMLVTVLVLLFAVGASGADTIKIGLMAPLTGFAAADGASVHKSV